MAETITQTVFPFAGKRRIVSRFDAEPISSDGGAALLRQVDRRVNLIDTVAAVLPDVRDTRYVGHSIREMLRQRVFQIALGYEDCNDAATLRHDPVLKACCDRDPVADPDLASQPTLCRLENAIGPKSCYLLGRELLESYVKRHSKRPKEIVLDLDTTDDTVHGQQEFRFFHAYYDEYILLPLLVFDQNGDLLTAVLQPGKPSGSRVPVAVLRRIIARLRQAWPDIPILVRGDSGFAAPEMYAMCNDLKVDFLLGLGPNSRLKKLAAKPRLKAVRRFLRTEQKGKAFSSFAYKARKGWRKSYRVLVKAEWSSLGENTRFVVTTLGGRSDELYDRYTQRGESCENSIKDLKNALRADRLSCRRFWANQFRLLLHALAYVLMFELRRAARGTPLEKAQMDTIRIRLLKIGVHVRVSVRRIWFHLSSSFPWQDLWLLIAGRVLAGNST